MARTTLKVTRMADTAGQWHAPNELTAAVNTAVECYGQHPQTRVARSNLAAMANTNTAGQ